MNARQRRTYRRARTKAILGAFGAAMAAVAEEYKRMLDDEDSWSPGVLMGWYSAKAPPS